MSKPIVAVDLDEVLGQFVPTLVRWHNEIYNTNLTSNDFYSYEFHNVWGGTIDETSKKIYDFFESDLFINHFPIIDNAYDILERYKNDFEFHIVTSRQYSIENITRIWINENYPNIFNDNIHFGNHYDTLTNKPKKTKPEMVDNINATILIDDSIKYSTQCSQHGHRVLLFGNYAWNTNDNNELPYLVKRVNNWNEVAYQLDLILNESHIPIIYISKKLNFNLYTENILKNLNNHEFIKLCALNYSIPKVIEIALYLKNNYINIIMDEFHTSLIPKKGYSYDWKNGNHMIPRIEIKLKNNNFIDSNEIKNNINIKK